jgi:hypothetical protein
LVRFQNYVYGFSSSSIDFVCYAGKLLKSLNHRGAALVTYVSSQQLQTWIDQVECKMELIQGAVAPQKKRQNQTLHVRRRNSAEMIKALASQATYTSLPVKSHPSVPHIFGDED